MKATICDALERFAVLQICVNAFLLYLSLLTKMNSGVCRVDLDGGDKIHEKEDNIALSSLYHVVLNE